MYDRKYRFLQMIRTCVFEKTNESRGCARALLTKAHKLYECDVPDGGHSPERTTTSTDLMTVRIVVVQRAGLVHSPVVVGDPDAALPDGGVGTRCGRGVSAPTAALGCGYPVPIGRTRAMDGHRAT